MGTKMLQLPRAGKALDFHPIVRSPHDEYGLEALRLRSDLWDRMFKSLEEIPSRVESNPLVATVDQAEFEQMMAGVGTPPVGAESTLDHDYDEAPRATPTASAVMAEEEIGLSPKIKKLIAAGDFEEAGAEILRTGRRLCHAEEHLEKAKRRHKKAKRDYDESWDRFERMRSGNLVDRVPSQGILAAQARIRMDHPKKKRAARAS